MSHVESDDEATSLPTAADLVAEVGPSFNSMWRGGEHFYQHPMTISAATNNQNDSGTTADGKKTKRVLDEVRIVHYAASTAC